MLLGFNGATTMKASLEEDIRAASAAGFKALEIWAEKMNRYLEAHSVGQLRALFEARGISPASINSIEFITFRGGDYAKIQEQCRRYSEIAQAVGCDTIVVVPSPMPARATWADIKRESIGVLRDLSAIAAAYGTKLAYEFLGQANCSVPTLGRCWEIVEEVDLPNIGLVLDTFHFYAGNSSLTSIQKVTPEKLLILHINDSEDLPKPQLTDAHRLLPGEGVIPLHRILERLRRIGYDGLCSIELFRPAYWERDAEELARDARAKTFAILRRCGYDAD
jgi:2-keto-myo-inositol isomerase